MAGSGVDKPRPEVDRLRLGHRRERERVIVAELCAVAALEAVPHGDGNPAGEIKGSRRLEDDLVFALSLRQRAGNDRVADLADQDGEKALDRGGIRREVETEGDRRRQRDARRRVRRAGLDDRQQDGLLRLGDRCRADGGRGRRRGDLRCCLFDGWVKARIDIEAQNRAGCDQSHHDSSYQGGAPTMTRPEQTAYQFRIPSFLTRAGGAICRWNVKWWLDVTRRAGLWVRLL